MRWEALISKGSIVMAVFLVFASVVFVAGAQSKSKNVKNLVVGRWMVGKPENCGYWTFNEKTLICSSKTEPLIKPESYRYRFYEKGEAATAGFPFKKIAEKRNGERLVLTDTKGHDYWFEVEYVDNTHFLINSKNLATRQ